MDERLDIVVLVDRAQLSGGLGLKRGWHGTKRGSVSLSSRRLKSCLIRLIPGFAVAIIRTSSGYIAKGPSVTWGNWSIKSNPD
jgi:hypothetical protein